MKINACRVITRIWNTAQPHCINPPPRANRPPPIAINAIHSKTVLPVDTFPLRFNQQTPQTKQRSLTRNKRWSARQRVVHADRQHKTSACARCKHSCNQDKDHFAGIHVAEQSKTQRERLCQQANSFHKQVNWNKAPVIKGCMVSSLTKPVPLILKE